MEIINDSPTQKIPIRVSNTQLNQALAKALEYCKLGRYDFVMTQNDLPKIQKHFEHALKKQAQQQHIHHTELVSQLASNFANSLVQDSFSECFKSQRRISYNHTLVLYLFYLIGLVIRWGILLPLRTLWFFFSIMFAAAGMSLIKSVFVINKRLSKKIQLKFFQIIVKMMMFSFFTVIKVHGKPLPHAAGRVYVTNHTTTFDFGVLCSIVPFSTIGQKHVGLQGFIQRAICSAIDPVWFDRKDKTQRHNVSEYLKNRVNDPNALCSLLVFPEGCCVNNQFTVQFKKGAFELGAEVCPIAIKYRDTSNAAYQNSSQYGFVRYLVSLMTQWALVCDVWFLAPVKILPDETPDEFAHRTQLLVSNTAGLIPRQWDGYLKYLNVSEKMIQEQKDLYARQLGVAKEAEEEEVSYSITASVQ